MRMERKKVYGMFLLGTYTMYTVHYVHPTLCTPYTVQCKLYLESETLDRVSSWNPVLKPGFINGVRQFRR